MLYFCISLINCKHSLQDLNIIWLQGLSYLCL